jgi:large subunit ribosomal protein L11e
MILLFFQLRKENFSRTENIGFVNQELINLGMKCDPTTGILRMNIHIYLGCPGFSVMRRKHAPERMEKQRSISKEESIQ